MTDLLSAVEVNPDDASQGVKSVVIWLHGLGDSGYGFAPIVPELALADELATRFIFPHAPERAVTINNGYRMRAWYDIKSMDLDKRADEAGVLESVEQVEALIEQQIAQGIPASKIVIAGFSQGGVVAMHLATRSKHKFAGIMAMSTYMCQPQKLAEEHSKVNLHTPFMMMHGRQDDVVPMAIGVQAKDTLEQCGYTIRWHEFNMQHNVCAEQVQIIAQWLTDNLAESVA
ncbi:alpha/beta hydrolase [Flocculibacter collagenilyticus]|uniref:alpha/beta hydrolase n=1 Tax=Flocculibacter collagenilyticus TaxID=2744479 RepID=UPI0018F2FDBA|nr:alpha/beta fold hydrolase [Flocculibacter collagenilyticus]